MLRRTSTRNSEKEKTLKIGIVKFFILYVLYIYGPLEKEKLINEVIDRTCCSKLTISKYVNELKSNGFIKVVDNVVELTLKGLKLVVNNLQRNNKSRINTLNKSINGKKGCSFIIPHWSLELNPVTLRNFINFIKHELNTLKLRVRKYFSFNGFGYVFKIECFTKGLIDQLKNLELTQFIHNGILILYWSRRDKSLIFEYRSLPNKQIDQTFLTTEFIKHNLINCFNFINNMLIEYFIKLITLSKLSNLINRKDVEKLLHELFKECSIFEVSIKYFIHNINRQSSRLNLFTNFTRLNELMFEYFELGIKTKTFNKHKRPRRFRSNVITPFIKIDKFGIEVVVNLRLNDLRKRLKIKKILKKILYTVTKILCKFSVNTKIKICQLLKHINNLL